jgi:hypothetical protein
MEDKFKYVKFETVGSFVFVYNHVGEPLGMIKKERVGRFFHWCFYPYSDTYYTNGCLKEISGFITKLYKKKKGVTNA